MSFNPAIMAEAQRELSVHANRMAAEYEKLSADRPQMLFHYTNATGLFGIVKSNKLWATHTMFLNDKLEVQYAVELVDTELRKRLETAETEPLRALINRLMNTYKFTDMGFTAYVTCFCREGDLLSQWRGYGAQGAGFSLGLESRLIGLRWSERRAEHNFVLRRVIYDEITQQSLISQCVDFFAGQFANDMKRLGVDALESVLPAYCQVFRVVIAELLVTLKHPAFEQEHEWRAIFFTSAVANFANGEPDPVMFRTAGNLLVPYVEIDVSPQAGHQTGKIPLREIVVGPTSIPEQSIASVKMFLQLQGHAHTTVHASSVPLR